MKLHNPFKAESTRYAMAIIGIFAVSFGIAKLFDYLVNELGMGGPTLFALTFTGTLLTAIAGYVVYYIFTGKGLHD